MRPKMMSVNKMEWIGPVVVWKPAVQLVVRQPFASPVTTPRSSPPIHVEPSFGEWFASPCRSYILEASYLFASRVCRLFGLFWNFQRKNLPAKKKLHGTNTRTWKEIDRRRRWECRRSLPSCFGLASRTPKFISTSRDTSIYVSAEEEKVQRWT